MYIFWLKDKFLILVFFCLTSFSGVAQYSKPTDGDSVAMSPDTKWTQTTLYKTVAAPTVLVAAGMLTFYDNKVFDKYDVYQKRQELIPDFRTHADDYLQFAPIGVVYGLDLLGVKAKHRFINRSLRLLAAELLSNGIVFPLKKITHVARPDGSNFMSFPSGHTNQAFVSATFMHKELGYLSPWYSIGAYTTATAVGMLRMMNNRHWLSDVLVGAGVGILSTNIVYLVFPEGNSRTKPDKTSDLIIVPSYNQGNVGFHMLMTLK